MKSQCDVVLSAVLGVIDDASVSCAYPVKEVERDKLRLLNGSKNRGIGFFTLDLPSLDDVLLQALETGCLRASGPLSRRRSKEDLRPRFLWVLWSRIFDRMGCLLQDPCSTSIAFLRQIFCFGKKLELECSPSRISNTLETYHAIEKEIIPPQLCWENDDLGDEISSSDLSFFNSFGRSDELPLFEEPGASKKNPRFLAFLQRLDYVSRVLVSELGTFDPLGPNDFESGRFKHGPGAVADARGMHFKYIFPNWPRKLDGVFPFDWCGSHTVEPDYYPSSHEPPSRLLAVPKTAKGPRLIASEPVAHQWCQQKIATWLSKAYDSSLTGMFISLRDQGASQRLVARASALRDLATIDLSSASDRLSCRHVESLLVANCDLLRSVHAVRTRWVVDSMSTPKKFLKIKKFAAQGSALTFPVQSLFFLCVCLASAGAYDRKSILQLAGRVRVFGDDLIVPNTAYEDTVAFLEMLGLSVNKKKSFSSGFFREACGSDCYRGDDVTPVKPKRLLSLGTPEGCQALVDTINNLWRKGYWRAAKALERTAMSNAFALPIVGPYSGVTGLLSFCGTTTSHLRMRWNKYLQKTEFRVSHLRTKTRMVEQCVSATLLQYFTEAPRHVPLGYLWPSETRLGVARKPSSVWTKGWRDLEEYCVPG